MVYEFPPDLAKAVREQMAAGEYSSEDDLLRDALQALEERKIGAGVEDPIVVEGIRRGLADMNAGRSQSFEEFDAAFRARRPI